MSDKDETKQSHWYELLIWCPSQCYYYFEDKADGKKYCLYLRWRWDDPWTCELVGCNDEWDIEVPEFEFEEQFQADDYRLLEQSAQKAVSAPFPHIEELKEYIEPDY